MKLLKSLVAIAIVASFSLPISSCNDAVTESCEQQDMSEILNCDSEKNVEVCCETGAACVYKYNGQEYPDTQEGLSELADALGCTYKNAVAENEQKELIIKNLIELKSQAKFNLQ